MSCQDSKDPEPLNTPAPLLNSKGSIVVNFIIGWNGQVYSPLIFTDNGNQKDSREVLRIVKTWKYRPSKCNGIPSDSEALVTITQ